MERKCKRKNLCHWFDSNLLLRIKFLSLFILISGFVNAADFSSLFKIKSETEVGQKKGISGIVKDSKGLSLPGVTVAVKGTTMGVITDAQGKFNLPAATTNQTLVFTFIGMTSREIALNGQSNLNVVMEEANQNLEEVVVIGYGTIKKPDLTGSVGVVKVDDMAKAPVASFAEALAGRVAGVSVTASDGQPGSIPNIVIRGVGSLTQNTTPLYVIDGFPIENPDPSALNPEEIETMTVLKDASSTAIYGSRAANGVIIIQTKRGKTGKAVVTFSSQYGVQTTPKPIPLMSPYEYLKYQSELDPSLGSTRAFYAYDQALGRERTLEDYRNVPGTNFQDFVLRSGIVQIHNIALRGGNDKTKYSISGSIFDQTGVIINTGFKRYNGRVTIDQNVNEKVKTGVTVNYSDVTQYGQIINQGSISGTTSNTGNPTAFVLARAWMYQPIRATGDVTQDDIFDEFSVTGTSDYRVNPFTDLENQYSYNRTALMEANGYVSIDIAKDLFIKSTAGMRSNIYRQDRFYNSKTSQGSLTNPGNTNAINGSVSNSYTKSYSNENTINFKKTINDHSITALGLFAVNGTNLSVNGYGGRLLPNENLGIDGLDEGTAFNPDFHSSENTMVSYGGRLDYGYKSKYMVTLTYRADASSKFTEGNRWGYFPGFALAWNMQKEKFFSQAFPFVSSSKIRSSYGSNGNNRVGDFATYAQLNMNIDGYSFNNGTPTQAANVTTVANNLLKWEKVNTLDFGYELGILNNKYTLEVDLYRKSTENLLLNSALPPTTGFASAVKNIGSLRNDGLEISVNANIISTKSFRWNAGANISFNKNMVMKLTRGQQALLTNAAYVSQFNRPLYTAEIGKPSGMMIGWIWEGNYQYSDFDEVSPGVYILKPEVPANGNVRNTIQPGDIKYKDINGDGTMTDADITFIGRGQPIHMGGFSSDVSYKGFSLNLFFNWSYGNDLYNANRLLLEGNSNQYHLINQFASYANRWSPENQTNANYRTRGQGPIGYHSSRVVEDGSFLRLKTASLSYSIPAKIIKKLNMSDLTLNLSGQNLLTWTKYTGMDPEVSTRNNILTPGYDYSSYPKSPSIVFGVKASF